jgi:predicted Kef-type K+ transport protein
MDRSRVIRTVVIGLLLAVLLATVDAHTWDPPIVGFLTIFAAVMVATLAAVGIYSLGHSSSHKS